MVPQLIPKEKRDMTEAFRSVQNRRWDILMLFSVAVGILWTMSSRLPAAIGSPVSSSPSPREGFYAPDFTLETLTGDQVQLSRLRGKIVVLNFWTTWCPPCRAETPALETSYHAYKDMDVVILGVNLTDQDSLNDVQSFASSRTVCGVVGRHFFSGKGSQATQARSFSDRQSRSLYTACRNLRSADWLCIKFPEPVLIPTVASFCVDFNDSFAIGWFCNLPCYACDHLPI